MNFSECCFIFFEVLIIVLVVFIVFILVIVIKCIRTARINWSRRDWSWSRDSNNTISCRTCSNNAKFNRSLGIHKLKFIRKSDRSCLCNALLSGSTRVVVVRIWTLARTVICLDRITVAHCCKVSDLYIVFWKCHFSTKSVACKLFQVVGSLV